MAVTAQTKLNAEKLRADFPIFDQEIRGKRLAYLDSAVSSHKPRQVLDKLRTFYETQYANVHRGVYTLSEVATAEYEGAREKVARLVNAPEPRELIFTHGATESINLVAYAWGLDNLGPGDVVLVTELEHHSNFVPWQYIAKRTGATFKAIPLDEHGELKLDSLEELARAGNIKVVANNLVSNALGTINPVERLTAWAHEQGAIMVVDAAQAAPHHEIDVQQLDCDFLAFSSHKMCGPTSVGALWGRAELLESMAPFNLGGHMIRSVKLEETTWASCPTSSRPAHSRSRKQSASAQRWTTSPTSALPRSRSTSVSCSSMRSNASRTCPASSVTVPRRTAAPGSSRSTSKASTHTTSRRSSTWKASRSAPAITAASR